MSEWEGLSTDELLEHLPPVEYAPILSKLASLGLAEFRSQYAIPTPLDANSGVVDYKALIRTVTHEDLISPEYKWQAPFFDEHHLQWYRHNYEPELFLNEVDPLLPMKFRDLPIHKIWTPRQFHDYVHIITLPPETPSYEVMHDSVEMFKDAMYMYRLVNDAIQLRERESRSIIKDGRLHDKVQRRSIDIGKYEEQRKQFIGELEDRFSQGLPPDLTKLSVVNLEQISSVEDSLEKIRRGLGSVVMKHPSTGISGKTRKRTARPIKLPVEVRAAA